MAQVCSNLPANVVGPFRQTLFLGCTVKSFSSTIGWNEQETNVTVELIEDPCAPSAGSTKHYYPRPGVSSTWNAADPGFQTPTVGAPVYFRIEDFEFAGVIQSWAKKEDSSSFPTYSVTISDPRFLLENLTIITGEYAGEVKNVPNLVNAYGWLESISGDVCQLDEGLDCRPCSLDDGEYPDAETGLRPLLGSPANGFGGANENEQGVPWLRLKEAIQILLSGNSHTKYSPKGYAVFRGHSPVGIPAPAASMGRIAADNFDSQIVTDYNGNGYTTNYVVDISEIPFSPTYYRIGTTEQSLLSLISQVCADAGCDFYIELIITTSLDKVIKIRTVKRRAQPTLGEIEAFLNDNNDYLVSKNVGRELRNEPTSVFLYGANVESIYEVVPTGADGTLNIENWLPNNWHEIPVTQHWGLDSKGGFQDVTYFDGIRNGKPIKEWDVQVDILPLQEQLSKPLVNLLGIATPSYVISETEFRMAMSSFDTWYNYSLFAGITGISQVPSELYDNGIGTTFGNLLKQTNNFGTGLPFGGINSKLSNDHPNDLATNSTPANITIDWAGSFKKSESSPKKDLEKIHSFIKGIADTNYGKKFVVKVPEICYYKDHQSDNYIFSDSPTNAGYPSSGVSKILGLPLHSTGIDRFEEDETTKVEGIARYFFDSSTDPAILKSGGYEIKGTDFVKFKSGLYCPMSVENKVYLYPTGTAPNTGVIPAVIVDIKTSVFTGDPAVPINQGGYNIEAPGGKTSIPTGIKTTGDPFGDTLAKAMSLAPRSYTPSGMAIPMRSNTQRYGPWGYVGPAGPVRFEEDSELAPWNYQGYDILNSGANEKVVDGLTFMQAGERGGFTLVGYPVKQLGQDLRSPNKPFNSLVLEDKATNYGTYKYISTTPMDGSFGPNITSINVNIGEGGATTTYELATFTPSFGRMSKINANRIKEATKQRAENRKRKKEIDNLVALSKKGGGFGFSAIIGTIKDQVEGFIGEDNRNQSKNLIIGVSSTLSGGDEEDQDLSVTAGSDNSIMSKRSSTPDEIFKQTAIMSQEGIYRPVSKSGDGGLPGFTSGVEAITGNESHSQSPMGPIEEWSRPIVNCNYLDPLTSSGQDKHCVSSDSGAYHDIMQVGFGDSINQDGSGYGTTDLRQFIANGNDCPEDFRFLATKGPMVINGWGYDLQGKPIPNEADVAASAREGVYTAEGLTDKFMSGWLKKSKTWPVAPVDLRFDRSRGVWTVPNSFRIIQVENTGAEIAPGNSGSVKVLNPTTLYGSGGDLITTQTINLFVPSWQGDEVTSGESLYSFYDTNDSKWYPIQSGGGQDFKDLPYCGYTPDSGLTDCHKITCLELGTGLQLEAGTNILHAPLLEVSNNTTDCGTSSVPSSPASDMIFGNNINASRVDCVWTVAGLDQRAQGTAQACIAGSKTFDDEQFVKLIFSDNIGVDNGSCEMTIKGLDQKIYAQERNCLPGSEAIADQTFTQLTFGNNIGVSQNVCAMNIFGLDQKIQATEQSCITDSEDITAVMDKDFTKLIFSDNIGVEAGLGLLSCEMTIKGLDQRITAAVDTCITDSQNINDETFTQLVLSDNLGASKTDCQVHVMGLDQKVTSTAQGVLPGSETLNGERFTHFAFGDNIGVSKSGDCVIMISGLAPSGATGVGNIQGVAGCGTTAVGVGIFDTLKFDDGLQVVSEGSEDYTIRKVLQGVDKTGLASASNTITQLTAGCGINITQTATCELTIAVDGESNSGGSQTIRLVSDICCAGSGIDVKYRTLTFSSCGILTDAGTASSC